LYTTTLDTRQLQLPGQVQSAEFLEFLADDGFLGYQDFRVVEWDCERPGVNDLWPIKPMLVSDLYAYHQG
jgi:hypothetical protein